MKKKNTVLAIGCLFLGGCISGTLTSRIQEDAHGYFLEPNDSTVNSSARAIITHHEQGEAFSFYGRCTSGFGECWVFADENGYAEVISLVGEFVFVWSAHEGQIVALHLSNGSESVPITALDDLGSTNGVGLWLEVLIDSEDLSYSEQIELSHSK